MSEKNKPSWEKPTVMPLGSLANARGDNPVQCTDGGNAKQCSNGPSPSIAHCKSGTGPASGSCGPGSGGTD